LQFPEKERFFKGIHWKNVVSGCNLNPHDFELIFFPCINQQNKWRVENG